MKAEPEQKKIRNKLANMSPRTAASAYTVSAWKCLTLMETVRLPDGYTQKTVTVSASNITNTEVLRKSHSHPRNRC